MRRLIFPAVFLILLLASTTWSQQLSTRLTNKDVIDMVGLGLSDDIIISKIRSATAGGTLQFDTSVNGLKELKAAKVSDDVIKVMINPTPPAAPVVVAAAPMSNDPNLPPPEVGVYWKNGNAFTRIEGQAISQAKVGGKAGSMFTYGLRNEHWDAYLDGPQSKNVVNDHQPVFYLYVPDGAQRLRLLSDHPRKERRPQRVRNRKLRRHHRRQIRRQARQGDRLHCRARWHPHLQAQDRRSLEARR